MSANRLVEEQWLDRGSGGAVRTVQTYVSQVRKLLHVQTARLVTQPGGYVFELDRGDVDALRFERRTTWRSSWRTARRHARFRRARSRARA
jgi:DNA-binding SARP family transcriptional activator